MTLDFVLRDLAGNVDVTLVRNDDPAALGCRASARGFPVCAAAVTYEGLGYAAMLGWIQLVRSTDNRSGGREFEIDPYEPLGVTPHPFCWFGLAPTLFDAPSRGTRADLEWLAHSFLCFIGGAREARAILGFSWGFTVSEDEITPTGIAPVPADQWNEHRALLRRGHPAWRFAPAIGIGDDRPGRRAVYCSTPRDDRSPRRHDPTNAAILAPAAMPPMACPAATCSAPTCRPATRRRRGRSPGH